MGEFVELFFKHKVTLRHVTQPFRICLKTQENNNVCQSNHIENVSVEWQ